MGVPPGAAQRASISAEGLGTTPNTTKTASVDFRGSLGLCSYAEVSEADLLCRTSALSLLGNRFGSRTEEQ